MEKERDCDIRGRGKLVQIYRDPITRQVQQGLCTWRNGTANEEFGRKKAKPTNEEKIFLRPRKTIKINFYLVKSCVNTEDKTPTNQNKRGINLEDSNPFCDEINVANKEAEDKTTHSPQIKF